MTNDCQTDLFTFPKATASTFADEKTLTVKVHAIGIRIGGSNRSLWRDSGDDLTWRISPAATCCDFSGDVVASCGWEKNNLEGLAVMGTGLRLDALGSDRPDCIQISSGHVAPKPRNLSYREAASAVTPAAVAYKLARKALGVKPGMRVLILGDDDASTAWYLTQLLSHLGAEVVVMTDVDSFPLFKRAGADLIVNKQLSRPDRIAGPLDAAVNLDGSPLGEQLLAALRRGACIAQPDEAPPSSELLATLAYLFEEQILTPFETPAVNVAPDMLAECYYNKRELVIDLDD